MHSKTRTHEGKGQGTRQSERPPTSRRGKQIQKKSNHKRAHVERRCPDACGGEVGVRASVGEVGERAGWAGSGALVPAGWAEENGRSTPQQHGR